MKAICNLIMLLTLLILDITISVLLDFIEMLAFNYDNDVFGLNQLYEVVEVAVPLKVSTICGLVMA